MRFRELGATGLRVSEIGLGCGCFEDKDASYTSEALSIASDHGVNLIDLFSSNPQLRDAFGSALRGRRESFVLQSHIGSVWKEGQYMRSRTVDETASAFDDSLLRLGTDYIDIGMIHYVDAAGDWRNICDGPYIEYVLSLKRSGKIRHTGMSSHNPCAALAAVESGLIDVLMFSINPCYDMLPSNENVESLWADESYEKPLLNMDPERAALYELCAERGVGITVMKALGGGDLLTADSPAGVAITLNHCLHYALTRPAVASVFVGAGSLDELRTSIAYEDSSFEERDYASALASFPKIAWRGRCMYCGHCAPCPAGIDVASVTKFLRLVLASGRLTKLPETEREHYALLARHGSDCIGCGACESRCPFDVRVINNMREAARIFGY